LGHPERRCDALIARCALELSNAATGGVGHRLAGRLCLNEGRHHASTNAHNGMRRVGLAYVDARFGGLDRDDRRATLLLEESPDASDRPTSADAGHEVVDSAA
jgi:hypothetical protein